MKYDAEIVMLVCSKFSSRIEDFKKYGLVNIKNRKLKLNIITSDETIEGVEKNWPEQIDVNLISKPSPEYVNNLYSFFVDYDYENMDAKWLIKLDDDSCTDVDGLLSNLESFYDCDEPYYLAATCSRFKDFGANGRENWVVPHYIDSFGKYKPIAYNLKHEVECCVVSHAAIKKILKNEQSRILLTKRCELEGGCTDCALAFASSLAKVYPIDCPFITHYPTLEKFSLFSGGVKNHIHLIAREGFGENFNQNDRKSGSLYSILTKIIDKKSSDIEKRLENKKFLLETDNALKIYEFKTNFLLKIKFEDINYMWVEENGQIYIFDRSRLMHTLELDENGDLVGDSCKLICLQKN